MLNTNTPQPSAHNLESVEDNPAEPNNSLNLSNVSDNSEFFGWPTRQIMLEILNKMGLMG